MTLRQLFKIAEFQIDPARNVVSGPQGESAIEPKIMEVLCALASRPGHVFSRPELIDLVWGHSFGADESLTRAISQLRKVFGDSRDEARILETIQKRGYRLIAPVSPGVGGPSDRVPEGTAAVLPQPDHRAGSRARGWIAIAAATAFACAGGTLWWLQRDDAAPPPALVSRAVEPAGISVSLAEFSHEQKDPALEPLAKAVKAGLITNMSRTSLLHVDAPSAATPQEYTLRFRVEGAIQKAGTLMRVNVRLISAGDGVHIWAGNFDRPYDGRLALQDEFTSAITSELIPRILVAAKEALRKRPLETLAPWALTLLGTGVPGSDEVFLTPHTKDAYWLQRRALALDANYAPAHASLASALAYHALFNPPENTAAALAEAASHVQIALAKAPYVPEVLYQVAAYYRYRGEREKSVQTLRRILEIHPDDIQANIDLPFVEGQCGAGGRAAIDRLRAIDRGLSPASPIRRVVLSHLADIHLSNGEFRAARDAATRSRNIVQSAWSGITLAAALAQLGQSAEALRISAETKREWPNLDYAYFADRMVPRWCFGGPLTESARSAFRALDRLERGRQ